MSEITIHTDILRTIFSHLCDEAFTLYTTWLKLELADPKSAESIPAWDAYKAHIRACTNCKEAK